MRSIVKHSVHSNRMSHSSLHRLPHQQNLKFLSLKMCSVAVLTDNDNGCQQQVKHDYIGSFDFRQMNQKVKYNDYL